MSQPKWFTVLNPVVNGGVDESVQADIRKRLNANGFLIEFHITKYARHAIELVEDAAERGFTKFISIGGGGTLNEVINGLVDATDNCPDDIQLIHIPIGVINDFARHHKIPLQYQNWISQLPSAKLQQHDLGLAHFSIDGVAGQRYFVCNAGVGLAALAVRFVHEHFANGSTSMGELWRGVSNVLLSGKHSYLFNLTHDELSYQENYTFIHFAISKYFSKLKFAEESDTNNGLLTVVKGSGNLKKRQYLLALGRMVNNTLPKSKFIEAIETQSITVDATDSKTINYIHVDGELLGSGNVTLEIINRKLNFWLPAKQEI